MFKAPTKYLNELISNSGSVKDITAVTQNLILKSNFNIHFIVDECELDLKIILQNLCLKHCTHNSKCFTLKKDQRIILSNRDDEIYTISKLEPEHELTSPTIIKIRTQIKDFIPLSNYSIKLFKKVEHHLDEFKDLFGSKCSSDFYNNEKLLVIGNKKLFNSLPSSYPTCFVVENENGGVEIKYNSPVLPKIVILKNINLLNKYLAREINGENIIFKTCVFINASKYEHSLTTIRKFFHQQIFTRVIFVGEKDMKIDLGNDSLLLRWKWTIPEMNYFKNLEPAEYNIIRVFNDKLDYTIEEFYRTITNLEHKHTINLRSLFAFIRKLYFDWSIKSENNNKKLFKIKEDFELYLKEELYSNFDTNFNVDKIFCLLTQKYNLIISAITDCNKTKFLKDFNNFINQLIAPSFLCNNINDEIRTLYNQIKKKSPKINISDIKSLDLIQTSYWNDPKREYYSLIANQCISKAISISKSDDSQNNDLKIITSIYGNGKVKKFIDKLAIAKTQYNLLLYAIEEKGFSYHLNKYFEQLNNEYSSESRFKISGVEFNDKYFQSSNFSELIEALSKVQHEHREIDYYQIHLSQLTTSDSLVKLPASKSILKIEDDNKDVVKVEDLSVGDKVQIYENPDRKTLRIIFELKQPELIKKVDKFSEMWQSSLINYLNENKLTENILFEQLHFNGFTVSLNTLRKYLQREVTFPARKIDLIAIAKTTKNEFLNYEYLQSEMLPTISEYRGKSIEYGFKFSESINNYLINQELDSFISEWYTEREIEKIVSQISIMTIKKIELLTFKEVQNEGI